MKRTGPLSKARLETVFLWVKDFKRMRRFYHETLGLPIGYESADFAEVRTKGASIALHAGRKTVGKANGHWFMEFIVADLDAVVKTLRARKVRCAPIREESFGRITSFADPEGYEIGLDEPPRRS